MKQTLRCPKCGHSQILHVTEVADQMQRAANPYVRALLAHIGGGLAAGELEAAVCVACGYAELYVKDPRAIPIDGRYVRVLGRAKPPGYR